MGVNIENNLRKKVASQTKDIPYKKLIKKMLVTVIWKIIIIFRFYFQLLIK